MQDEQETLLIRATPYRHQREAVRYAMRLLAPREGGDVPPSMTGAGCALLMEM